ncbi:DUF7532 family protein [Halopelagius longus]|uniref:Uncharacterized protein n=1 Tax=Halopelagius longus TaxID=1236180 RepID=A0A1H1DXC3_9EURY|nr:hypothetical protein [Halopelagius longus]RDI71513.1 hypothetical protein DWB78_07140 [Halopelagius longus]SDQ81135.1 hypothetical protein SAMN05216278_2631 [Halopelagius longus]
MHFDPRTQAALREAGLSTDEIRAASDAVAEAVRRDADALEAFFEEGAVFSDMDRAHSSDDIHEHDVEYLDLYTHGGDLRGYLRFDSWGAYVEDGRVLSDEKVELTLGPTVHDRVRFARDPDDLR